MKHVHIHVTGMTCGGCVKSVQNALLSRKGVQSAKAELESGIVHVDFDPALIKQADIESAIKQAGFDVAAH